MNGGEFIPVARPCAGKEELNAIEEVFKSGWLGMGLKVKEFEDKISNFIGNGTYVVAVNTGTTAMHLSLDAIGIRDKDEVLVPSLTFVATIQAITAQGAVPVFCDIEKETLNISIEDAKDKITSKTKAIMPVHYRGVPCEMDKIIAFAAVNKLRIIEDAAHAFGSSYNGRRIGSFGDLTCFSFDPIKNITCGEGGAVLTRDKEILSILQKKRILGIDKDTLSRYENQRSWDYDVVTQGYRYHMSNINAAIGLEQLKKFTGFNRRKIEIARRYDKEFSGLAQLEVINTDYNGVALFMYVVLVKQKREELMLYLRQNKIESGIHYIPAHLFSFYKHLATALPVTEQIYKRILTLPLYADMADEEVKLVIGKIKEFWS